MYPEQKIGIDVSWSRAILGSTLLGLFPYIDRGVYALTGVDLLGDLYPGWIFALFLGLGVLAGATFSLRGALGGVTSCVIGLSLLTALGFVGDGGDGNLFYWIGGLGSAYFTFCALAIGGLRKMMTRSKARRQTKNPSHVDVAPLITFPETASDGEIRHAVVSWSELLAQEKYGEALGMFLHSSDSMGFVWTPGQLQDWVSNYGCARADFDSGEWKKVATIFQQPDPDSYIRKAIEVDRANLCGLDPKYYLGVVHYDRALLDGKPSDLTARFNIKRLESGCITLEFLDVHVM